MGFLVERTALQTWPGQVSGAGAWPRAQSGLPLAAITAWTSALLWVIHGFIPAKCLAR